MDKSLVFTPGCKYTFVKEGCHNISGHVIMFVEYETVSGERKRQRFDLVDPSVHFVIDGHRQAQLSYISDPPEGVKLDIKRVLYREESCGAIIGGKMFVPTRIEFDTVIHVPKESPDVDSDRVKMINKRIARDTLNSAYGIASRDWADVLADSARYIHMQQSRCSGKTLWLSSATSFADKQPLWNITKYHDICEQWLKEPPKPYEFISDDLEDCEKGVPNTKLYVQNTVTGEITDFDGIKSISPIARMTYKGVVYTNPTSENGKQGVMSREPLYEKRDYFQAEIGDVVLYGGKHFVWLGKVEGWKEIDLNGYFDTDMAVEENAAEKLIETCMKVKEEKKVAAFDFYKLKVHKVIFNDPATIVFWSDGSKTVVKCGENDIFDPEKGIAMCCMKRLLGTNKTGSNYLDRVKEYIQQWREDQEEGDNVINTVIKAILNDIHLPAKDVNTDAMDIPPEVTVEKEFEAVTSNDWNVVPADENTTAEENGE